MLRRQFLFVGSAAMAAASAGCSTGPTSAGGGSTAPSAEVTGGAEVGVFPATLKHAFGSTTVSQQPRRVVTVGPSDQDFVAALGVAPVGASRITWGGNARGSTPWFDEAVQRLGSPSITRFDDADGIPADQIAALRPDLILGVNSGMSSAEYSRLSRIAPTVAYLGKPWSTTWQDTLSTIGRALGRPGRAQEVAAATTRTISQAVAKYPQVKGRSAVWAWFSPTDLSTVTVYTSADMRPRMLREFGMVDPPIVTSLTRAASGFSATVSAEKASELKADALIFYVDRDANLKRITDSALLSRIPPLANRHYISSADNTTALTMSSPSPLSIPVAVEKFLPKIASAVNGKPAS